MNDWLFFIGLCMAFVCFSTAFFDWAMNKPYDRWSIHGFVIGMVGVGLCWLATSLRT